MSRTLAESGDGPYRESIGISSATQLGANTSFCRSRFDQLKDRLLETVVLLHDAFLCAFNALQIMNRHKEALEYAKENYTLWAMNHMRNPGMFDAAFALIQSCIQW